MTFMLPIERPDFEKTIQLFVHQKAFKQDVRASWQAGHRNVLGVSPTGSGKSVIVTDFVLDYHVSGMRTAVIAHRNELVSQMSCHLANRGIEHRIIASDKTVTKIQQNHREKFGRSFVNPTSNTSVVGVDTLISRKERLKEWAKQIDLWVVDEAHHVVGNDRTDRNKWGKAVAMFSNALGLGVTATPERADGQGLGSHVDSCFDDMVLGPGTSWLIENHFLCDYEIVCPLSDLKVDDLKKSKDGDWSSKTLKKASKESKIVGDVIGNYVKYALGRQAIVFATDIETANELAEKFNVVGVRAASVNGKSDDSYREQSVRAFEKGDLQVLVNVDLFDEGFDVPSCGVVIMARPTASLGKYLQMVGRVLRYEEGKTALIIDHVSNVIRHGLPDKKRAWSLERVERKSKKVKDPDEIELTRCVNPGCNRPYEKFRIACPYCGQMKPMPEPKSRSVPMVEGDLMLLDKAMLARMRASIELETGEDVGKRVAAVAGSFAGRGVCNRQNEKIAAQKELFDAIAQWAAVGRQNGFTDRELYKKFYLTTGQDVLTALGADKSRKDYQQMNEKVRSWYEGKSC